MMERWSGGCGRNTVRSDADADTGPRGPKGPRGLRGPRGLGSQGRRPQARVHGTRANVDGACVANDMLVGVTLKGRGERGGGGDER